MPGVLSIGLLVPFFVLPSLAFQSAHGKWSLRLYTSLAELHNVHDVKIFSKNYIKLDQGHNIY